MKTDKKKYTFIVLWKGMNAVRDMFANTFCLLHRGVE